MGEWNPTSGQRWSWFLTYLRRTYDPGAQYFRGVEVQARGAVHFHVVVRTTSAAAGRMMSHFRPRDPRCPLRLMAVARGFGHEIDLKRLDGSPEAVERAAGYVSKYVSKAADERHEVPWRPDGVDGGERRATYRTWSASRGWGASMTAMRAAQTLHERRLAREAQEPPPAAGVAPVGPLDPNSDNYTEVPEELSFRT